jgi:ketosteroid isomerase-like protein
MTEADRAQIEAEVMEAMDIFSDGFREMDMEKVASVAHPDLLAYPFVGQVLNWTEFREALLAWAEGKESWAAHWVDTNVRVISPDLAVFSATTVDTVWFSDGRVIHYPSNATAFLFERTPDGWKFSMGGPSNSAPQPVEEG